jgi:hypothetical protein
VSTACGEMRRGEGHVEVLQVVDCSDGLVPAFTRWAVPSWDHEMAGGISSISNHQHICIEGMWLLFGRFFGLTGGHDWSAVSIYAGRPTGIDAMIHRYRDSKGGWRR